MPGDETEHEDEGKEKKEKEKGGFFSRLKRYLSRFLQGFLRNQEFAEDGDVDESILEILNSPEVLLMTGGGVEVARNFVDVKNFVAENLETILSCGVVFSVAIIEMQMQNAKIENLYREDLKSLCSSVISVKKIMPKLDEYEVEIKDLVKSGIADESETAQAEKKRQFKYIFMNIPLELRSAREHMKLADEVTTVVGGRIIEYEATRLNPYVNGVSGVLLISTYLVASTMTYAQYFCRKTVLCVSCSALIGFLLSYGSLQVKLGSIRDELKKRRLVTKTLKKQIDIAEDRLVSLKELAEEELQNGN